MLLMSENELDLSSLNWLEMFRLDRKIYYIAKVFTHLFTHT